MSSACQEVQAFAEQTGISTADWSILDYETVCIVAGVRDRSTVDSLASHLQDRGFFIELMEPKFSYGPWGLIASVQGAAKHPPAPENP